MNIIRTNEKIKIEKCEKSPNKKLILTEDEENLKLGKIDIKDSKYYFTPVTKSTNVLNESISSVSEINNLSWLVYKGQKIPSNNKNKYIIKEGDVIKLGREILLIREIHFKNKNMNNNETKKGNNEMGLSFHTQTSQSLNLNEDFNLENKDNNENIDNDENNLVEEHDKTIKENENEGDEKNKKLFSNDVNENKNHDTASCNSDKNSEMIKKSRKICRICYMGETDKKINPLIKPCQCSGSMKYIHYECLLHWLKTKVLVNNNSYYNNGFFTVYILNLIECELCKNRLPNYIKHSNKVYSLIDYDKFDKEKKILKKNKNDSFNDNYIIFDEITPGKEGNKYRYLVNFDENNSIKIGRGLEMQLILNDISVSRNHCRLKLDEEGNIILEDNNSKFGTLVLIQAKSIEILKGKTLTVQVGTNYLNININRQKNLFGCCNVEEIDERNSYEKINNNSVKFDKKSEILNESLSESSDGEEKEVLKEKEKEDLNIRKSDSNEQNENKKNKKEKGYINYNYNSNISDLRVKNEQKSNNNNIKLIKKRIESISSKNNSNLAGSNTTIKNDDKNILVKKENIIPEKKEEDKSDNNNNNNKSDNDSEDDSEESSDENYSSD